MSFYDRLLSETVREREAFLAIPLIREAVAHGASRALYLDFLAQAYHHVRHTVPLLALAASRLGPDDAAYRDALIAYMDEEKGHDEWILEDIAALGGDAAAVARGEPRLPCKVMVAYAYHAIERTSPYCLLGMVHVLEGMSVQLAHSAADAIAAALGGRPGEHGGFSYLTSHGALDVEHVQFFQELVNRLPSPEVEDLVIQAARDFYRLYGDIFRDLHAQPREDSDAA